MAVLKIAPFWGSAKRRSSTPGIALDESVGLDAFGSETPRIGPRDAGRPAAPPPAKKTLGFSRRLTKRTWVIVASATAIVACGTTAYALRNHSLPWTTKAGSVTFETVPRDLDVFVGDKRIGRSPMTVDLAAGTYAVRLGSGPSARSVTITVKPATSIVEHYEMPVAAVAPPVNTGHLRIQTDPANLPVLVDGVQKGVSPVTVDDIKAGDHDVAVRADQAVIKRSVHVAAGEMTSVIISSTPSKPDPKIVTAGWLAVSSPIPVTVKDGGRLIGTTDVDKLMLSSGDHDLELDNEALGFHVTRRVNITPGKTTVSSISVPNGSLNLNALPWAEVFVDGKHLGQTPLGNLSLPIGRHEVVFRHPDLGERKETVTVTTAAPARLGVDLRKK